MSAGPDQAAAAGGVHVHDAGNVQIGERNAQFNIAPGAIVFIVRDGESLRPVDASGELEQVARRLLGTGLDQVRALDETGVESGIAAPPTLTPAAGIGAPAAAGSGGPGAGATPGAAAAWQLLQGATTMTPIRTDAAGERRLAQGFSQVSAQLGQIGGRLPGTVVGVQAGAQSLDLVDLLVRRGSLALWRFRQASARLYGEQTTAFFRAVLEWPSPPEVQMLAMRARADIEVLRGVALFFAIGPRLQDRPWVLAPLSEQLAQGRWSAALDGLEGTAGVDGESVAQLRTQIEAIGLPYAPAEVGAAVEEAEQAFREALRLDGANTSALVNLAMLLAESAQFDYVANGRRDSERLRSAQAYFAHARGLLSQRADFAARGELARCRLNAAIMLPPDAALESQPLPAEYAQLMRASLNRAAQQPIRWDVVQRNIARGNVDLVDRAGVAEAGQLFAAAGESALAEQCALMLRRMDEARMNRAARLQWMRTVRPVVGSWGFRGGGLAGSFAGTVVFDADGQYHRFMEGQSLMTGPFREVSVGAYAVQGNALQSQGMQWILAPMPMPPAPTGGLLMLQQVGPEQMYLFNPTDGSQVQCWRL